MRDALLRLGTEPRLRWRGTRIAEFPVSGRFAAVIGGDMAQSSLADARRVTGWSIALSVLMIIAGILAIASPLVAGIAVTRIVGWLLLFSGALHFMYAFRGGGVSAVLWEILLGIVYALVGFYVLANPAVGLSTLTFMIALYLFVEAMLEFAESYMTRHEMAGWRTQIEARGLRCAIDVRSADGAIA